MWLRSKAGSTPRLGTSKAFLLLLAVFVLGGCEGERGARGEPGPPGISPDPVPPPTMPAPPGIGPMSLKIDGAEVNAAGHPVVTFTLRHADGSPYPDLGQVGTASFTFAKLAPRTRYDSGHDWQNYIVRERTPGTTGDRVLGSGAKTVQGAGTEAIDPARLDYVGNGQYRYTFGLDVNNARRVVAGIGNQIKCVAGGALNGTDDLCHWLDGTALPAGVRVVGDEFIVDYDPGLTHRVAMQLGGGLPATNAWYDFVPAGGPVTTTRDIVTVQSCNSCHEKLAFHGGSRVATQMCVTCHNPGSVDANSGRTNDFKQMIHKLHRGSTLPSVASAKIPYFIRNSVTYDWSGVKFPQAVNEGSTGPTGVNYGIDNCLKCHMGPDSKEAVTKLAGNDTVLVDRLKLATVTKDGDLWRQRSIEACSSCHDNVYWWTGAAAESLPAMLAQLYSVAAGPAGDGATLPLGDWRTKEHPGGTNSTGRWAGCATGGCHDNVAQSLSADAVYPTLGNRGDGSVATMPTFQAHLSFLRAAIRSDMLETQIASATLGADSGGTTPLEVRIRVWDKAQNKALTHGVDATFALGFVVGWMGDGSPDYNHSNHATWPGRTLDLTTDWSALTPDAEGYYTVSLSIPTANLPATGTGTVATQSGVTLLNTWGIEPGVPVVRPLHVTQSFSIGGATVTPRRVVVDAMQTCRTCHMRFSKHGPTGRNNPQLCVLCHNPNNTDVSHAARQGRLGEYDGKKEESKDFKRMIHAIHGSAKRGLCVNDDEPCYPGYQLRAVAFSMPSKLAEKSFTTATLTARTSHFPTGRSVGNCNSCHVNNSYELNRTSGGLKTRGVIGSTYSTGTHPAGDIPDPATGLAAGMNLLSNHTKFSPVMSVCSACHTTRLSRNHMLQMGASDQASIDNRDPNAESCGLCHGPGAVAGLEVVHPVK